MPFIGIGIHVLIALFFAVHAVRTGRELYWLMILFFFPLLGSVVYFLAIYLPDSRLQQGVRKATAAAARSLDPGRDLREAQQAFELTPTAQNQMRLAAAYLDTGAAAQAAEHYEACLKGPFAGDPEIRFGAAQARLQNGQGAAAIELIEAIKKQNPDYRAEQVSLLLARAYALAGRDADARAEYGYAATRFGSLETRAEYAIWALNVGDIDTATALQKELEQSMKHWNKHAHLMNRPLVQRLDAAFAAARKA